MGQAGPANQVDIDLPDKFYEQVECDLIFFHQQKHTAFHLVGQCTRYQEAMLLDLKATRRVT